ncbi:hypothetical protein ZOD2009_00370 [Haladaptatus paucihalophilus DX253]|uniref:Uncharacterized protein n=1 Tax=Haladaptatus paucihalophilus DX253 TaxID=797209 RepID=E7QMQ6_HALPU|nr:hypothetical protein [Haladaptatus paucihalophilus]EFW94240.1 hypothetical protein ZOD2009_00370 [Haladaptatus paucihalophilus DX253]SHL34757.1 hypothetical protein SAMN05444342_3603 [Haladaptatus paucihalophilus DX253]
MSNPTTFGASSVLDDNDVSISDLAKHVQTLTDRIQDLEQEVAEKDERINELEEQVTNQASVEWRGEAKKAANLWVGPYPLGKAVARHGERLDDQDQRIDDLERGEVDVSDVLDLDGTGNQLQIQRDTAARKTGNHELSKNKERATFVWAAFHERARRGHGKMRLPSWLVKQILDEHGLDTNPNTVRRVMEFVARGTSQNETSDPEDDNNLVTLKHRNEKNILVADEDEWESFFAEQTEHVSTVDEDADTNNQRSNDGTDDQADTDTVRENADEEFDVLSSAAPITSDEDESITEEITVS